MLRAFRTAPMSKQRNEVETFGIKTFEAIRLAFAIGGIVRLTFSTTQKLNKILKFSRKLVRS